MTKKNVDYDGRVSFAMLVDILLIIDWWDQSVGLDQNV